MVRRVGPLLVLWISAAACTAGGAGPAPSPMSYGPSSTGLSTPVVPSSSSKPIVLDVVADARAGPGSIVAHGTYLDGMRTAVSHVNSNGGVAGRPLELAVHDDRGDEGLAAELIDGLLGAGVTAVLYVGPGSVLTDLRPQVERAGTPLILLEGDLYTRRGLYREVFQTTIPWEWQANVIARYLVTDREAGRITFAGSGPEAEGAARALRSALAYWGGSLAGSFVGDPADTGQLERALGRTNPDRWTVVFASPPDAAQLVSSIEEIGGRDRPGIAGPAALLVGPTEGGATPSSRLVACYTYTWSGWAEPIPRVGSFRRRVQAETGRWPHGLQQEGYDAVRVVSEALGASGGRGGHELTDAIEDLPARAYSSFPVAFGPDDHVFLPRDELGLFASALAGDDLDPWMVAGADLWRPLMRTFTYDGERDNILDRDRKVFFPFWEKNQPGPEYWRSRYGIVTKPSDPVH